jgi:hypothetical protein
VRVFVVHSEERLEFERAQRMKSMERVRIKLAALQKRVAKGKLKSAEKIGAAAAAILARNHGHRYPTQSGLGEAHLLTLAQRVDAGGDDDVAFGEPAGDLTTVSVS